MDTKTLGVDLGTRRIGVAISDALGLAAHPLTTLERHGNRQDAAALAEVVATEGVSRVVVGMPLALDGTHGPRARQTAAFVAALAAALGDGVPVETWDERFSTVAASRTMKEVGLSRTKRDARVDQEAAAVILQGWLDAHRTDA